MKLPDSINRYLSERYLRRMGVKWNGVTPFFNILNPPQFIVGKNARLELGSGVKFFTHMGPTLIKVDDDATITIGDHSVLNSRIWIRARKEILIGDYVLIGPNSVILDANLHPISPTDPQTPKLVSLERNCWIGASCIIHPGVWVGRHSIVSAGSDVRGSVPPKTIFGGNPAVFMKGFECPHDWIRVEF